MDSEIYRAELCIPLNQSTGCFDRFSKKYENICQEFGGKSGKCCAEVINVK